MSISGYKGSYGAKHLGPNTTTLGVDPLPRKGVSRLVLTFDHRVIDGAPATKVLQELERMVKTAIKVELAEMIGVHPKTGEKLTKEEMLAFKQHMRRRRMETARKRKAA